MKLTFLQNDKYNEGSKNNNNAAQDVIKSNKEAN